MKMGNSFWSVLIVFAIGFLFGYFLARSYQEEPKEIIKTVVKYEKSSTDTIKIDNPVPYKVYDTITELQVVYVVDTNKVIDDYFKVREYKLDFSNDTLGSFLVNAKVHQNLLLSAEAQIMPIIKTMTNKEIKYEVKTFSFYTMLGTSIDLKCNKVSAGIKLRDKYIIGVSSIRMNDCFNYTIDFGMVF